MKHIPQRKQPGCHGDGFERCNINISIAIGRNIIGEIQNA
jgi:hypothetical protein